MIAYLLDLAHILEDHNVEDSLMDISCSDDLFLTVRETMEPHNEVAPYLGITKQKVDNIRRDNCDSEKARKLEVLREWKKQKASGATRRSLVKAFLKMKDRVTAEEIVSHAKIAYTTRYHQPCPNDVMPEQALQRYPRWEDMDNEEQKEIKETLIEEHDKITRSYGVCLSNLKTYFSKHVDFDLDNIKINLTSYIATDSAKIAIPMLQAAETISQIFFVIAEHSSWFNYRILELLVEVIDDEKGTSIFTNYLEDTLKPYLERSIFLVPAKSMATHSTTTSPYVSCTLVLGDVYVQGLPAREIMLITKKLAKLLQIPSLQLMSYKCGSLCLVFGIYQELFEYLLQQDDSLLHRYIKRNEQNAFFLIVDATL